MADSNSNAQAQPPTPSPALKQLDRLVGMWDVSGGVPGQVTYEWMEGGFFLMQHVALGNAKGLEVIGHLQSLGEAPSADIHSRYYDTIGNTFDYVYELDADMLTIWGWRERFASILQGNIQ